jgi:hypothetical protein
MTAYMLLSGMKRGKNVPKTQRLNDRCNRTFTKYSWKLRTFHHSIATLCITSACSSQSRVFLFGRVSESSK